MELAPVVVSPIFKQLVDLLAPVVSREARFFFWGVEGDAKKLVEVLLNIQLLLSDAEDRQIEGRYIRQWLSKLKDAAYDAEDIVDELAFKVLPSKQEAQIMTQVLHFFPRLVSNRQMGYRIKEIIKRLEDIKSESNDLRLKVVYDSKRLNPRKERPPTSSFVDESTVIGRDADKEKVISLLKSDNDHSSSSSSSAAAAAAGGRNGLQVIPICGMGGLGKTTLAQMVYNDEQVKKHFEVRAWIYVSQDFDLIRLTKAIAESVPGGSPNLTGFDNIQVSIKEAVRERRFLVVLDDVWNENYNDWDALRAPLMSGATGSRILVTTRSRTVSSIVGTVPTHLLRGLSDEDCWSLFERRAFVEGNSDAHSDLKKIGEEIVKKCNGLPLAVKSLGGLLRSKVDVVQWEAILESEIWGLSDDKNDILPALRLSYHHLPAHLKRCFAYCCMFGKGFYKDGDELVLKWMAQGYIQSEGSKHMEDIGWEYLDYLVSCSLLDTCPNSPVFPYLEHSNFAVRCLLFGVPVRAYTMHDLSHDLARSVFGAEFLDVVDVKSHKNVEKACHISYDLSRTNSFDYEDLCCFKSLRTHMFFLPPSPFHTYNIPADFFINLTHLRLLELTNSSLMELPESIGNLIHLRLLDLTRMKIKKLPESLTRLYHLQTLRLDFCFGLVELPSDFSNLVNLRHLSLRCCRVSMPPGIGKLTNLYEMGEFNVKKEIGWRINELKDMINLRGLLRISKLENVVNVQEAKEAELNRKPKIHRLQLQWKTDDVELRQEGIEEEVLEALQPHTNLKNLEIEGYCGGTCPRWLGYSSLSEEVGLLHLTSLQSLTISDCCNLNCLTTGLQHLTSLEHLEVSKCPRLTSLVDVLPTTLLRLCIEDCRNLLSIGLQNLTSLDRLTLITCPKIHSLPEELPTTLQFMSIFDCCNLNCLPTGVQKLSSLLVLTLHMCPKIHSLPKELPTTLQSLYIFGCPLLQEKCQEGGDYWCKISHIPRKFIR